HERQRVNLAICFHEKSSIELRDSRGNDGLINRAVHGARLGSPSDSLFIRPRVLEFAPWPPDGAPCGSYCTSGISPTLCACPTCGEAAIIFSSQRHSRIRRSCGPSVVLTTSSFIGAAWDQQEIMEPNALGIGGHTRGGSATHNLSPIVDVERF